MSDTKAKDEKPKNKKKGKVKTLLLASGLIAILGGGGAAGGFYAAGMVGGEHSEPEDPNQPKIILKDGTEVSEKEAKHALPKESTSDFKITYHQISRTASRNCRSPYRHFMTSVFSKMSSITRSPFDQRSSWSWVSRMPTILSSRKASSG